VDPLSGGRIESGLKIRIALAGKADAFDLVVVRTGSWREAYRGILPQPYLDGLRKQTKMDFPAGTWLIEADKIIAGYLSTGIERLDSIPETVEIKELYVHPNYWRMGLGRTLVDSVHEQLAARGCGEIYLWVLEANEKGRAFYEAIGFKKDRRKKLVPTAGKDFPVVLYRRAS